MGRCKAKLGSWRTGTFGKHGTRKDPLGRSLLCGCALFRSLWIVFACLYFSQIHSSRGLNRMAVSCYRSLCFTSCPTSSGKLSHNLRRHTTTPSLALRQLLQISRKVHEESGEDGECHCARYNTTNTYATSKHSRTPHWDQTANLHIICAATRSTETFASCAVRSEGHLLPPQRPARVRSQRHQTFPGWKLAKIRPNLSLA